MQKRTKANQSIEKMLQIIEVMAQARGPMRLSDLSRAVQMPASTVLRMVGTLTDHGYAYQERDTAQYGLTLKFSQIGSLIHGQFDLRNVARPYLIELSRRCDESTCLAIEEAMEVIYLDVVEGPDSMLRITQRIGKRAPMHSTGVGKLMLTQYSTEGLRRLAEERGLERLTPNTAGTLEQLTEELSRIRQAGYALDNEECELGARCVAAPVRDYEGRIVAAISVSGPVSRMTEARVSDILPQLLDTAGEVSGMLAYGGARAASR